MKRIVRGDRETLAAHDPELARHFGAERSGDASAAEEKLARIVACAIIDASEAWPAVFAKAMDAHSPVEKLRAEARLLDIPLASLLYGIRPDIAEEVRPFRDEDIAMCLALADMDQHVWDELVIATNGEPLGALMHYLTDKNTWEKARASICSSATGNVHAYALFQVGFTAAEVKRLSPHTSLLVDALIHGSDLRYAARAIDAGIADAKEIASYSKSGISLEYATAC